MKNSFLIIATLGMLLTALGQAAAEEKELERNQVPKAVIDAFEKAFPGIKPSEFEEETFVGNPAYEVEFKKKGIEYEAVFSADGTLLQKEEEIDVKSLPDSVVQAINKTYPKATIKEVEKLLKPDDTVTGYEVEIKSEGKKIELDLDSNGNILRTENK